MSGAANRRRGARAEVAVVNWLRTHGMPTPASCVDCMYEGNLTAPPAPEPEARASGAYCNRWVHDGCAP